MESKAADAVPMGAAEELARLKAAAAESEKEQAPFRFAEAARYWAALKSKARAAGEYATLRTRQGVSLFGEPNIGAIKTIVDRC